MATPDHHDALNKILPDLRSRYVSYGRLSVSFFSTPSRSLVFVMNRILTSIPFLSSVYLPNPLLFFSLPYPSVFSSLLLWVWSSQTIMSSDNHVFVLKKCYSIILFELCNLSHNISLLLSQWNRPESMSYVLIFFAPHHMRKKLLSHQFKLDTCFLMSKTQK